MTPEQQKALQELASKSLAQIQQETAYTWAYRAWAARYLAKQYKARGDWANLLKLTSDATEYEHESLEHAALSGNDDVLTNARAIIRMPSPDAG